jgi:hypothetical protein
MKDCISIYFFLKHFVKTEPVTYGATHYAFFSNTKLVPKTDGEDGTVSTFVGKLVEI